MKSNKWLSLCPGGCQWGKWFTVPVMLALAVLAAYLSGPNAPVRGVNAGYPNLPILHVALGNKTVKLWVAASQRARDHGLMYIRTMPDNRGMLFVFHRTGPETFWMKHTLIPLDLLFLNQKGLIVRHYTMQPDNGKKLYPSGQPIGYAIELNAGVFRHFHLHNGMQINIPPLPATVPLKSAPAS